MKYIGVLFISSMEYNIYFYWPTTYKSYCILNALQNIYIILKIMIIDCEKCATPQKISKDTYRILEKYSTILY